MIGRIFGFIKRHKIWTAIIVLAVIGLALFLTRPKPQSTEDYITLAKTDVVQEVDVTGRIEAAEKVQLMPETSGKIAAVNVKVGDKVSAGQVLVQIDSSDLQIRLAKQQLELRRAELALREVERGPNRSSRLESENNLERAYESKFNAEEDLERTIDSGYNAVSDAFLDMPDVITTLRDILGHSYLSQNILRIRYGNTGVQYRDNAMKLYYDAEKALDDATDKYRAANRQSDDATVKALILSTYEASKDLSDAIKATVNLVDYAERRSDSDFLPSQLPADKAELSVLTRTLNIHVVSLLDIKNSITKSEQEISNAIRVIQERDASYRDLNEEDEFDLESARINVEQAKLDVQAIQDEINKRAIKAPMDGIITDVNAKRGELTSMSAPAVSVISVTNFQVAANLPEIDVAKVKVGMEADVELDPYGNDVVFPMVVSSISPAESLVEGVAVYKIVLQFVKADDRIKSGFTADVTIKTERRDGVLAVPQRAVITKSGGKFVRIKEGESVVDKPVTTGLRGSDGDIEILTGLNEGDQVLVFAESE